MKIKRLAVVIMVLTILAVTAVSVYAAGDVASAVESTWTTARGQIKTVVNNVVFPVLDLILAVFFFVKLEHFGPLIYFSALLSLSVKLSALSIRFVTT